MVRTKKIKEDKIEDQGRDEDEGELEGIEDLID